MIAARFSMIGWVAGCAVAALGCYLTSQRVAAERATVARVDREIETTGADIRRLTTEIAARGRMAQIERWNTQVLALQAPAPGQFVDNEVQLASLAGGKPLPLDPAIAASHGAVNTVAYHPDAATPAAPVAADAPTEAPEQPMLRSATYVRAKPDPLDPATPAIIKASLTRPVIARPDADDAPAPKPVEKAKTVEKAKIAEKTKIADKKIADGAPDKVKPASKPKASPGLTASLLPSDLGSLIAAEKKAGRTAKK